jgi:hypothetical protein
MTEQTELQLVHKSQYWQSWQASKKYNLQINVFSSSVDLDKVKVTNQIDPYVVIFLDRDRSGSKRKTSVLKKTTSPVWNECLMFTDIDVSEKLCIEVKMSSWGSFNPVLGSISFTVGDIVKLNNQERKNKLFVLTPGSPGINAATIILGFAFNPPVTGNLSDADNDRSFPVYLSSNGAFSSFLFDNFTTNSNKAAETNEEIPPPPAPSDDQAPSKTARPFSSAMKLFGNA